jgi:hypothetical protein
MAIEKQIVLQLKGNSYTIEFPNVGKFQSIETMKQVLSRGMYSSIISMNTVSSIEMLDMVDIESYLTVLCPKLIKDLKCNSFSDLGLEDYLELKKVYQATFIPWWNMIIELLNPRKKEEEE